MSVRLRASTRTSAKSQHEEALAQDLYVMSRREVNPWPVAERELHPFWCCEEPVRMHAAHPRRYRLAPGLIYHYLKRERDFRVDFAYPSQRLAVEVDGLLYGSQVGSHQTGAGVTRDREKDAALRLAGWDVIRVSPTQVKDGTAVTLIEAALKVRS